VNVQLIEFWLWNLFGLVAFGLELWALLDCVRHRADSFQRAFKRTKGFWLGITAGSAAVGGLSLAGWMPLFLGFIALIAACVYLADVKPALAEVKGGRGQGPYGPW
jgi:hypothetical protein